MYYIVDRLPERKPHMVRSWYLPSFKVVECRAAAQCHFPSGKNSQHLLHLLIYPDPLPIPFHLSLIRSHRLSAVLDVKISLRKTSWRTLSSSQSLGNFRRTSFYPFTPPRSPIQPPHMFFTLIVFLLLLLLARLCIFAHNM